ncbi:protein transport protein Sec24B [Ceratina calcarata]|uniref:Protein transport protein Sec24B n=1 Tax=Ceratina calcarata TaxID=156304 RepID=A0AAJ7WAC2_9HYME|nr:protein transport protein Sec24B [Ceratina calcarata]XP_026668213.1 protein transport protein Sec24B [Ceratina calcarata]
MSQPTDYQYQAYGNGSNLKSVPPPPQMVNGQASTAHHNGMQPANYNFTGTSSSQSSRDPSRETSRDPSPTPYLHTQYGPPLRPPLPPIPQMPAVPQVPPMPPVNGQNTMNPSPMNPMMQARPPPLSQSQQYPPMYQATNQFQVPVTRSQPPMEPAKPSVNSQMEPPRTVAYDQNLPQGSLLDSKPPYKVDSVQGTQAYTQPQENVVTPSSQPPRAQNMYQQNLMGQRGYPKPAYNVQHPNTMPYGMAGSGQVPAKVPTPTAGHPGQRMYPGQPPNPMNMPPDSMSKRYPESYPDQINQLNNQMNTMNVSQYGYNKLWGMESVDLLQCRNILPPERVEPPKIKLHQEFLDSVNCSPDIFRCTLTKIPETNSLLQKSRLPLGVLIHPFKDLNHLPVIQCSTIVRCRACRTYINPFVYFNDAKRWKCNLCYRVNELPEEFQFDPVTKSYGDPSRRPEVKTSTIEFIAPSEYMLRPPQPAVYLFVLDVSRLAVESGYLSIVCDVIADELSRLPGDSRTQIGFLAVDSAIHFFGIPDNVSQPQEMIMLDINDVFLPCPDNLIVNLKEREELVRDLLAQLPTKFQGTHDTNSALGAALQAAYKLMSPTGGRVTVFQTCLPNIGPGILQAREDPNNRSSKDVAHLNPATDFYKRLALDCSGQQIAVDLFLLNCQYCDLATLSGMCKFSGGCIYHLPLFRSSIPQHADALGRMLRRYLARKIGFEAVMRIRCTRGLSIHTFHGNFFVRSTDLLTLPNVNPDAGFGMQISIDENLSDCQSVCFQAALLYTSSKGERRIRVHTLCLPVVSNLSDILHSADQQCIVGLLGKMAVDRSLQSSLSDARDALINVPIDVLSAYKLSQSAGSGALLAPGSLKLLPLYIIALLKCVAFRSGTNTRLDDRVYAMCQLDTLPLFQLIQMIYPDLYPVHALDDRNAKDIDGKLCPQPPRLHLSAEKLDSRGAFLMDTGNQIFILIGKNIHPSFCCNVLGVSAFPSIPEEFYDLPKIDTPESERLRNFVFSLQEEKPYAASVQIIRDDSHFRTLFIERLIEDRFENSLSYYEFLQHIKTQVK